MQRFYFLLLNLKFSKHFTGLVFLLLFIFSFNVKAGQFPNLSGEIFIESRVALINNESTPNTYSNSFVANIEPKFSLNINEEWSVKTQWKISPVRNRSDPNFEIGNVFPSTRSPDNIDDYGLVVEELKGDYRTDDLNFFFGKYNPTFGKAWDKRKRIGVFTTDFTQDYELREKLGFGVAALMDDDGAVTLNLFFNDTTGMSNSALNRRGKNKSSDNFAGNNTNLSSYSITMSGNNFFDIEDLSYNFGYRDLDVDNKLGFDNEKGFVVGFEYKIPLNYKTYFTPFAEISKINNFNGIEGQDLLYTTIAATLNYSKWHVGVSGVVRDINRNGADDFLDSQAQYFVGYLFDTGIALDVAHIDIKESDNKAKMVGVNLSYNYEF
jgi:hypothetical protein